MSDDGKVSLSLSLPFFFLGRKIWYTSYKSRRENNCLKEQMNIDDDDEWRLGFSR